SSNNAPSSTGTTPSWRSPCRAARWSAGEPGLRLFAGWRCDRLRDRSPRRRAMNTQPPDDSWLPLEYFENQKKITAEMWWPYADQHIAWSWDGSRILDADPSLEGLMRKLKVSGVDTNRVVFDYVDVQG